MPRLWTVVGIVALLLCADAARASRPKTDTVWTDTDDKVVCEILELEHAQLSVKTHNMGTIQINWRNTVALESSYYYRVETKGGDRYFGSIARDPGSTDLQVRRPMDTVLLRATDVVQIAEIRKTFWQRWDGSLSIGFTFTQASGVAQLTLYWTNIYNTERDIVALKAQTIITGNSDNDTTSRLEDFAIVYNRLTQKYLIGSVSAGYQRNDEIGLLRRVIFGLTAGVNPFRTNLHTLLISAGAALNSEVGTADTSEVTQSAEGIVRANYSLFKYTHPKSDINTTLTYYPSLTEEGRHRVDFDLKFKYELVRNFYFDLSYYTNYDSKPATEGAAKADYGIVTSIAWTY